MSHVPKLPGRTRSISSIISQLNAQASFQERRKSCHQTGFPALGLRFTIGMHKAVIQKNAVKRFEEKRSGHTNLQVQFRKKEDDKNCRESQ
jgi:hypothetical protein